MSKFYYKDTAPETHYPNPRRFRPGPETVEDFLGNTVRVGDFIVYTRYQGGMYKGIVLRFTPKGYPVVKCYREQIEWRYTRGTYEKIPKGHKLDLDETIVFSQFVKVAMTVEEEQDEIVTMKVCAKTSDLFAASYINGRGEKVGDYDGYVPDFMPEEHYGDYVELDINVKTGQIINWSFPSQEELLMSLIEM